MLNNGVEIKYDKKVGSKLRGNTFCITGVLENFTRDRLVEIIQKESGNITSSISKKTNYLIRERER